MQRVVNSTWSRVVGYFLAGLLTLLPLVITIAIVVWVAGFVEAIIGPDTFVGRRLQGIGSVFAPDSTFTTLSYLIGCLLVLAVIFLLGIFVRLGGKNILQSLIGPLLRGIPVVGSVYSTASQIVGMLERNDEADIKGMSVVYCTFGEANGAGVLALLPTQDRYRINKLEYQAVYVPTSPVPMTGGLMFVPVDSVHPVDMSVDGLMSIYLSMGVTGPKFLAQANAIDPSGPRAVE